ncbi:MAG: right-handed parallel beta-helix repeat-containing protein [Bacteroidales bacterium]|nr:right-handed parallel beta-helix repeat-containing protein [Bacteroidales bacterium]
MNNTENKSAPASAAGRQDAGNLDTGQKTAIHELNAGVSNAVSVVWPLRQAEEISVGGAGADISGFTSGAIQKAADILKERGNGGIIKLTKGEFDIISPVRLHDNMTLTGEGAATILRKCRGYRSPMALDADYGELRITVVDASGFSEGMGVAIFDDAQRSGWDLTTARITSIEGNTVYIDEYLVRDYRSDKGGTLSNASSVIEAVSAKNITISNLVVDGSGDSNDFIDGCRAGGIYLHKVHKALIENVGVRNFNSDGISWQITEYVTVRNCEVSGCKNSGLHPGTGSPYTLIEGNNSHHNGGYGLFVCWRVRDGIVRNNRFHNNGNNGISTGHKDTDMLFTANHIFENGGDGVHLRGETELNSPHRTVISNNIIENNGTREEGYGISINNRASGVRIEGNTFSNTGKGKQKAAVLLLGSSLDPELKSNTVSGMAEGEIVDRREK